MGEAEASQRFWQAAQVPGIKTGVHREPQVNPKWFGSEKYNRNGFHFLSGSGVCLWFRNTRTSGDHQQNIRTQAYSHNTSPVFHACSARSVFCAERVLLLCSTRDEVQNETCIRSRMSWGNAATIQIVPSPLDIATACRLAALQPPRSLTFHVPCGTRSVVKQNCVLP